MSENAPSPLHRALRWSLPGAALLSIPGGAWLQPQLLALVGIRFTVSWESLMLPVGLLAVITPFTSCIALNHLFREKVAFRSGLVATLNFLALLASAGVLLSPLLLFLLMGRRGLNLN